MVSLSRNFNTGGATFFSESGNMEDRERLQPHLDTYNVFKPLKTIPAASINLVLSLALEITAIVLACLHPDEQSKCSYYFILLYIHVALWFVTLVNIFSFWLCLASRKRDRSLPDFIYDDRNDTHNNRTHKTQPEFSKRDFCALVKVRRFNKQKLLPDVLKEEWAACSNNERFPDGEVGYRGSNDNNDLIEKQADLIRHLQEYNSRLSQQIMELNGQIPKPSQNIQS